MPALSVTTDDNGWQETSLGELCEIYQPKTISKKQMIEEGEYSVFGANGVIGRYNEYNHENSELVIGCRGSVGTVHITEPKSWITGNAMVVRPDETLVLRRFLEYAFQGPIDLSSVVTGTAQPQITRTNLSPVRFRFPPLPEQRRILSILDKIFDNIRVNKNQIIQKKEGPRELFQSLLRSSFDGEEGWTTMALEDCTKFIDYRGRTPKKTESGLRLITAKNAKMGYLQLEPREFVAPESYDSWMTRGIPLKGDVIFTTEAPLGNVCQLDTDEKVVFAQRIITLQANREILNPAFLKYSLMSPQMQSIILEQATGATVSGIKAKLLKKVAVSFPSIEKQNATIQQFDSLSKKINQIEQTYQQEIDSFDELKQSILQEAFNGRL